MKMTHKIGARTFDVKETGGRFFYFSPLAGRWLPVARAKVNFEDSLDEQRAWYDTSAELA